MTEFASSKDTRHTIRRVATGQAANGLSVIVSDTEVVPVESALMPGGRFYSFWGADSLPTLPDKGAKPPYATWFPVDGGYRFELFTLPPDRAPKSPVADKEAALAETEKLLPGLMDVMDPKHPGWHATDTIDLIYVASGACILKLDGGEETPLKAGDTLVQTGSRHAWSNPGEVPCELLVVSIGVKRRG
ncbi:MAG: cupin domain-containing protein [Methyloceanibacter sp.]|uniref:cupin domain-containing protein n=1 Tax=Methyloceanibacter sp. TaxID=1965321 RepID=UPI003D6D01B2